LGVIMGLCLGILPGIGGVAGTALLLPFTYSMDAPSAMALLLGLGATTTTADPISAIVLGAPGHAASAATTLDGYPMTRRGEAGWPVRCGADGRAASGGAAADPVCRLAGIVVSRGVRHLNGFRAVGKHSAARAHLRLLRHDAGDDRIRSANRHAALDHGATL